eukprot:TRINITY_DN21603_c0_g1_i1.p1 TRINITY_DN21603_c0_g1~~TRINITY_DN21603_c0_g1_i1.p1  ORF type:complete len:487 (-),score=90.49 TRINITY_DN21603_c0_g1_i1:22-1482(-)
MSLGHPPPPPPKARLPERPADVPDSWDDDSGAASEAETYVEDDLARAAESSHANFDAPRRRLDTAAANRAVGHHLGGSGGSAAQPPPPPKAGPPAVQQQSLAPAPSKDSSRAYDGSSVHWLPLGQAGQLVLCLSCQQNDLLQHAANILDLALASLPGATADRGDVREETMDAWTQTMQVVRTRAEWRDESFALKLSFKNTAAMGLGSNVQKRTRTSRLAMALALVCDYTKIHTRLFQSYPALEQLATHAWMRKSEAPASMSIEGGTAAVAGACCATSPGPSPMHAPATRHVPPAPTAMQSFRQRAIAAGVPEDCIEDPFLELRENGSGWEQGFCIACRKVIDSWHIATPKHQQYLQDVRGTLAWRGITAAQLEQAQAPSARNAVADAPTFAAADWSGGDLQPSLRASGRPPLAPQLPATPSQPAAPPHPPDSAEVPPPPTKEEMCRFSMQFASRLGLLPSTIIYNVDDDDLPLENDPSTMREVVEV